MKRFLKYGVVPVVVFVFLTIVTVMLMPTLINVQRFVPAIEEELSAATGRSISLGPDFGLSFVPWLSFSFTNLKIGNPRGFLTDEFVKFDSFEVRIKLLPLLKREIQISRFVVDGMLVNLERNSEGKVNWDFGSIDSVQGSAARLPERPRADGLEGSLFCSLLAVTDGRVNWIDRTKNERHTVENLMLVLNDITLHHPSAIDFKALYDGKPLALEGRVGPLWPATANQTVPVDINFLLLDKLQGRLEGKVENWWSAPRYDINFSISSFSPREIYASLAIPFPVVASDPETFTTVGLSGVIKGNKEEFFIENGAAQLDDTQFTFSLEAHDFKRPNLRFSLAADYLDFDRYLSTGADSEKQMERKESKQFSATAYVFLNKVFLDGVLKIQKLKLYGGSVVDLDMHMNGRDGVFTFDPCNMSLYGGQLQANISVDFGGEIPKTRITSQSHGLQIGSLLREFGGENILSGSLDSDLVVDFSGSSIEAGMKTLSGQVTFSCLNGSLFGVDLLHSGKNERSGNGASSTEKATLRTDFSELKSVVGLSNGLLDIRDTTLTSPAASFLITGTGDLASKEFDLQVRPGEGTLDQGRNDKAKAPAPYKFSGKLAKDELDRGSQKHPEMLGIDGSTTDVANLVDEKIPSPMDEDVKNLVGKSLIDPAVVAQRFRLQPESIKRDEVKKQLQVGSGIIRIKPLQEELTVH